MVRLLTTLQPLQHHNLSILVAFVLNFGCFASASSQEPTERSLNTGNYISAATELLDHYNLSNESLRLLHQAEFSSNNNPVIAYHIGITYLRRNQSKLGVSYLEKSIEIEPNYARPHFNLGKHYLMNKNYNAAIENFKKSRKIYRSKLRGQFHSHDIDGHRKELHLNLAKSFSNIGWASHMQGDSKTAILNTKAAAVAYLNIKNIGMFNKTNNTLNTLLQNYGFLSFAQAINQFKTILHIYEEADGNIP